MFLSRFLSASANEKISFARRCSDGGWLKIRFFVRPETTSGFRPRATGKRKIPATVKFLFKIGTACSRKTLTIRGI